MNRARKLRFAVAVGLFIALVYFAATAHSAVWVEFRFTTPIEPPDWPKQRPVRYRMEVQNGSAWDSVRIYRAPGIEGVPVQPAGTIDTIFVSQTTAALTSRQYRLVYYDVVATRSLASNLAIWATGFPDTIAGLSRPVYGSGRAFKRTYGQPTPWTLQYGDSADVHVLHFEDIQRAESARICRLYGYWCLRGGKLVCP